MGKKADEYIASRVNSVIGKGTEFEGTIRTKETIRVEGFVKGNIISEGTVIIGNGGNVDGKIEAANILIGGEVHGELYASEKIEANSSGKIFGNLHTKGLIVDEKALFQGTCEMTGREESKSAAKEALAPEAEATQETA
ncbi:MAG: polymer-forming cytoskeletal protein [Lachnospiraceae bacterium]|nr:polymer-forming cytoskeletal protein [Lachnospiraceae bacterium]